MSNQELTIIDGHFHLGRLCGAESALEIMRFCHIDKIALLAITANHNGPPPGENRYQPAFVDEMGANLLQNPLLMYMKALYPDKFYGFGGLYHKLPGAGMKITDFQEQAEKLHEIGFDGMKMIEGHVWARRNLGTRLDDPVYYGYYGFLERKGIPFVFHAASPWYFQEDPERENECYSAIDSILSRYPKLKMILAHFYFLDESYERAAEFLEKWQNVAYDLTPHWGMYESFSKNIDIWRNFFVNYQDRIIFGADKSGGRGPDPNAPDISGDLPRAVASYGRIRNFLECEEYELNGENKKGLMLGTDILKKIYCENFKKYAGDEPKRINLRFAAEECKKHVKIASKSAAGIKIVPEILTIIEKLENMEQL